MQLDEKLYICTNFITITYINELCTIFSQRPHMKIRYNILLHFVLVTIICSAQRKNTDILIEQAKTQQIGYLLYNNKSNEQIIELRSSENFNQKDTSKIIFEKSIYESGVKKGRLLARFEKNGTLVKEFKHNISTFPSRAYHFVKYLPNRFTRSKKSDRELKAALIIKDSQNNVIFVKIANWEETYKYDEKGNLIEIYNYFNPINSDSSFTIFCLSTAKSWKGKYENNNLVEEETTWDNGKTIKSIHTWKNDTLYESSCTSFLTGETRLTKYVYEKNTISQILEYTQKGKLALKKEYKWN